MTASRPTKRKRVSQSKYNAALEAVMMRDGFRCANADCRRMAPAGSHHDLHHLNHDPETFDVDRICLLCLRCNRSRDPERTKGMVFITNASGVQSPKPAHGLENAVTVCSERERKRKGTGSKTGRH
jgi:hypothetical protein